MTRRSLLASLLGGGAASAAPATRAVPFWLKSIAVGGVSPEYALLNADMAAVDYSSVRLKRVSFQTLINDDLGMFSTENFKCPNVPAMTTPTA